MPLLHAAAPDDVLLSFSFNCPILISALLYCSYCIAITFVFSVLKLSIDEFCSVFFGLPHCQACLLLVCPLIEFGNAAKLHAAVKFSIFPLLSSTAEMIIAMF